MAGVPVVTGPHLHNFTDIARGMREAGAMRVVESGDALSDALDALLDNAAERQRMGEAGLRLAESGRGALARTLAAVGL